MKTLVIVDVQNDFVNPSALGSKEAEAIIDPLCDLIRSWKGDIIVTLDTHGCDYLETREGQMLPVPHCVKPTKGWQLHDDVAEALSMKPRVKYIEKSSFGSFEIPKNISNFETDEIVVVGLVLNICVISNALILRSIFKDIKITIYTNCTAATSKEDYDASIRILKSNHINVI